MTEEWRQACSHRRSHSKLGYLPQTVLTLLGLVHEGIDQHHPRRWKPQFPHDCPHCQAGLRLQVLRSKTDIRPYSECKSRRGRKKILPTHGFACPNPECLYCGMTDNQLHALVGYSSHNGIQRFKCQAGAKVFTSRVNIPLYYLKTAPKQVEFVLLFARLRQVGLRPLIQTAFVERVNLTFRQSVAALSQRR